MRALVRSGWGQAADFAEIDEGAADGRIIEQWLLDYDRALVASLQR